MPKGLKPLALFRYMADGEGRFLKITLLSGVFLALLTGGTLAFFSLDRAAGPVPAEDSFHRSLGDYDEAVRAREDPDRLDRMLDRLEQKTQGVESRLSLLKRRRALARTNPRLVPAYREAARKAAAAYPYSEPLAAVAAAALLPGISENTAAELRAYASVLSAAPFSPLRISLHILLGDFKNPQTAAALPRISTVLADALPSLREPAYPQAAEALAADLAILKLLEGAADGAAAAVQSGLYEPRGSVLPAAPSPEFLRFAAEYFYDFGDPLRAAELFSRLGTDADIIRQADALWLSGRPENARNIWTILVSPAGENAPAEVSPAITARALYNLALTAADSREAAAYLEQLAALPAAGPGRKYGIIRYSRLLDASRGLAVLEQGLRDFPEDPLLDLELLRRHAAPAGRGETWEPGRVIGETWLLLGRHPGAEELYRWGAWYFDYQRKRDETARLLKTAARYHFDGPWFRLHEALGSIGDGDLDGAEEILSAIPPETAAWQVSANLGRILEARLSPAAALERYEIAASLVQSREEAARIQLRIARCLKSLGRARESRRVLEYALDLDPGNLNARLELRRLDNPEN